MSRGVLAIFGILSQSSVQTAIDLTNYYKIPFITWSHTIKISDFNDKLKFKRFFV